jgi:hypothetical protein
LNLFKIEPHNRWLSISITGAAKNRLTPLHLNSAGAGRGRIGGGGAVEKGEREETGGGRGGEGRRERGDEEGGGGGRKKAKTYMCVT